MLQLALSSDSNSGKAEMFIDYQEGGVGFTIIHADYQHDFSLEDDEWEMLTNFIEKAKTLEEIRNKKQLK